MQRDVAGRFCGFGGSMGAGKTVERWLRVLHEHPRHFWNEGLEALDDVYDAPEWTHCLSIACLVDDCCVVARGWPSWLTRPHFHDVFSTRVRVFSFGLEESVKLLVWGKPEDATHFIYWNREAWGCDSEGFVIWRAAPTMIGRQQTDHVNVSLRLAMPDELKALRHETLLEYVLKGQCLCLRCKHARKRHHADWEDRRVCPCNACCSARAVAPRAPQHF